MITSALQTGFTGMQNSLRGMNDASHRLVNSGYQETAVERGSMADARLDLLEQQQVFTASAEVVSAADRSLGALIDTRA